MGEQLCSAKYHRDLNKICSSRSCASCARTIYCGSLAFPPGHQAWAWMLVSYRPLAQSRFSSRLTMAAIPTRAGREAVERLTEAEATAFINRDKETIKTELDAMTFVPLAPRPAEAPAGPNHLAERLRLAAELDEARRNLEEQVAERAAADLYAGLAAAPPRETRTILLRGSTPRSRRCAATGPRTPSRRSPALGMALFPAVSPK